MAGIWVIMPVDIQFPCCISRRAHSIPSFVAHSISWKLLSSENTLLLQKQVQGQPLTPRMAVEAFREGSHVVQPSFAGNYWSREWFLCGYECITRGGGCCELLWVRAASWGSLNSSHRCTQKGVGSLQLSPVLVCCLRRLWKVCSFACATGRGWASCPLLRAWNHGVLNGKGILEILTLC